MARNRAGGRWATTDQLEGLRAQRPDKVAGLVGHRHDAMRGALRHDIDWVRSRSFIVKHSGRCGLYAYYHLQVLEGLHEDHVVGHRDEAERRAAELRRGHVPDPAEPHLR